MWSNLQTVETSANSLRRRRQVKVSHPSTIACAVVQTNVSQPSTMPEDQLATLYLAATVVDEQLATRPCTPKGLDELRKRLLPGDMVGVPLKRYAAEGVSGPMPARVVFVEAERASSPTPPSSPMRMREEEGKENRQQQ